MSAHLGETNMLMNKNQMVQQIECCVTSVFTAWHSNTLGHAVAASGTTGGMNLIGIYRSMVT
jgi:hypothetical protein